MFHQCHIPGALLADVRLATAHTFNPFFRRLNGRVRRVVGQVEEERPFLAGARANGLDGRLRESVRRMALWINGVAVVAHVVVTQAQMGVVVVHHVPQKAPEFIEAAFQGIVLRF